MIPVEIVVVLVLVEYWIMGILAGNARLKYGVPAPATTGHPIFERYYRVHHNTLEALMVFVPTVLMFGYFTSALGALILGALFFLARLIYAIGYVSEPNQRYYGAAATAVINGALLVGSLIGLIRGL